MQVGWWRSRCTSVGGAAGLGLRPGGRRPSSASTQGSQRQSCWPAAAGTSTASASSLVLVFVAGRSLRRLRPIRKRWLIGRASADPSAAPASAFLTEQQARPRRSRSSVVRSAHTGVVLLNIGTPASTDVEDVRGYLTRFLWDKKVVDIEDPESKRAALQAILQRAAKSAENYRKIWHPTRGSPLLYHTCDLVEGLQRELGTSYAVCIGFQYSEPSVETALAYLLSQDIEEIILVPMFPHFAEGTVGAILANTCMVGAALGCGSRLRVIPPFYRSSVYLEATTAHLVAHIGHGGSHFDFVVFSFYGVPERQCTVTDETQAVCMKVADCCSRQTFATRNCYRAQCQETAKLLADAAGLPEGRWRVAYQSRAAVRGAIAWVRPYTDEVLAALPSEGKKRIAVFAPSFTADNIETLLELGEEGRRNFLEAGGHEFHLVPSLNGSQAWAASLAQMIREYPGGQGAAGRGYWAM